MPTVQVTDSNFDETTQSGIVLLDWWAAWCGPCRMFAPVFEAASKRHPDVVFGKVDTEEETALVAAFDIRSIPTLMAFRDGILVFAQPGMLPAAAVDQLIAEVKKLDMDEVRRMISKEKQQEKEKAKANEAAS